MCGRHSLLEKGEVDLVKVIQGNDYLYIVRITRRIEPFAVNEAKLDQREVAAWSDYLKRISLCNDTSPEHACPQEESPP